MGDEQDRFLDRARELLRELQRPNAYTVLGVTRETPKSEIQAAFMRAVHIQAQTGHSMQELAAAHLEMMDAQKRLELDAQSLDCDEWLSELENLRNRYALFDFLGDLRRT